MATPLRATEDSSLALQDEDKEPIQANMTQRHGRKL